MRLMPCLALFLVLFAAVPAEAGNNGNFVVLSNGQIVALSTNNDYFGNSFYSVQTSNRVFVNDGFYGNNVNVLDFRRPIIRPMVIIRPGIIRPTVIIR